MNRYQPVNRQIYRDRAAQWHVNFRRDLEGIRADPSLTASGKREQIALAYQQALGEIHQARADEERHIAERKEYLEDNLFNVTPRTGAADFISYRDAQDRVASIPADDAEDTAMRYLAQAERSGDTHLAKAVIQRAMEEEWVPVLNRYAETHAGTEPKLQELFDLTAGTRTTTSLMQSFITEGTYTIPAPAELSGPLLGDPEATSSTAA